VAGQLVLLVLIALSAIVGLGWPDGIRTAMTIVGLVLLAAGLALVLAGGVQLGPAMTPFPLPRSGGELREHGVYAHVRHPIYTGAILFAAGWSVVFASIVGAVLTLLLVLFFDLKSRREEHWLVERYPQYAAYRARTRARFVPGLY
jgi:protein-S-isoprenylcysteine O-methyltransferase Ste14